MPAGAQPLPWCYAVDDRPVKVVEQPGGHMETLVLDWASGAFVRDESYFMQVITPGKDVDQFTKEEFETRVRLLRLPIAEKLVATRIPWEHTGDGEVPYSAKLGQATLAIRVNDFPAEPLYTLIANGEEIVDMDDWPAAWEMPPMPQALLDKLGIRND